MIISGVSKHELPATDVQNDVENKVNDSQQVNEDDPKHDVHSTGNSNSSADVTDTDYFTFVYRNGTIDFNNSMNFDSKKFIEDIKRTLSKITNPAESHKFKLFMCQAFKIPMDDLIVNQSNEKFSETLGDYVSEFDKDNLQANIGTQGLDQDDFDDFDGGLDDE